MVTLREFRRRAALGVNVTGIRIDPESVYDKDLTPHELLALPPGYEPIRCEATPDGIDMNKAGAKADAGKLLPRLVLGEFARALEQVVEVGTKGARKYTPRGWLKVKNGRDRYAEAADRHQLAVNKGIVYDDGEGGTGCYHKAQVIWNLLAEFELELRQKERKNK